MRWVTRRRFIALFELNWVIYFKKMSIWPPTYKQSVFKRYHSDKHLSEFYLQNSTGIDMEQNLLHCHPMYTRFPNLECGLTGGKKPEKRSRSRPWVGQCSAWIASRVAMSGAPFWLRDAETALEHTHRRRHTDTHTHTQRERERERETEWRTGHLESNAI